LYYGTYNATKREYDIDPKYKSYLMDMASSRGFNPRGVYSVLGSLRSLADYYHPKYLEEDLGITTHRNSDYFGITLNSPNLVTARNPKRHTRLGDTGADIVLALLVEAYKTQNTVK
jgi:hypothetical protein